MLLEAVFTEEGIEKIKKTLKKFMNKTKEKTIMHEFIITFDNPIDDEYDLVEENLEDAGFDTTSLITTTTIYASKASSSDSSEVLKEAMIAVKNALDYDGKFVIGVVKNTYEVWYNKKDKQWEYDETD